MPSVDEGPYLDRRHPMRSSWQKEIEICPIKATESRLRGPTSNACWMTTPRLVRSAFSSTDWDVLIALHAPNPQKDKTLEVLCRKCDYNMTPDEIAKLYD